MHELFSWLTTEKAAGLVAIIAAAAVYWAGSKKRAVADASDSDMRRFLDLLEEFVVLLRKDMRERRAMDEEEQEHDRVRTALLVQIRDAIVPEKGQQPMVEVKRRPLPSSDV